MRTFFPAFLAAVAALTSVASAAEVTILDRAVANDYQYTYGGAVGGVAPFTDGENSFTLDTTAGGGGGGSGGGSGDFAGLVADPTVAGQGVFTVTFDIEGFGAATGDYFYAGELQFQDNENTLGITDSNPANAVLIAFSPTDLGAAGPTSNSFVLDASSTFNRGTFADLATLVGTGELDAVSININADSSGADYGNDADNGFATRNLTVTQTQVTAVPEPTSMAVLGVIGTGAVIRRRRRRN